MKIGLDFDRVLFDTDGFKKELEQKFPGFSETYEEAKKEGYYNLKKHAELLNIPEEELLSEFSRCSDFLYELKPLNDLRKEHDIVIVTRGDPVIQKEKMNESGVLGHVDDYYIVQEEPKDVGGIEFLVDDRQEEIERAGLPGFKLERPEENLEDVLKAVREFET